ncbi:LamB/YcsF family protein [Gordonibacter sp.]
MELHADTLCVHGDTPQALAFVQRIRQSLEADGIAILAVGAA